jgi:ATP-dependent helicase YprA (DUF1998 family)
MDVFQLRRRVVDDYAAYIRSFITIADPGIKQRVEEDLGSGLLWPEPLLQLSPSFERGLRIDEHIARGDPHPACDAIFRVKKPNGDGPLLQLHKHQSEAIAAANSGDNYILTTGTGWGKSLAYPCTTRWRTPCVRGWRISRGWIQGRRIREWPIRVNSIRKL